MQKQQQAKRKRTQIYATVEQQTTIKRIDDWRRRRDIIVPRSKAIDELLNRALDAEEIAR